MLDNVIEKVLPDPDGPGELNPLTSPVYQWVYDAAAQLTSETDPLGRTTEHIRDNLGNEIQTILPDPDGTGELNPLASPVWQYQFDANSSLVKTIDPLGHETVNQLDNLGRRIKVTDAADGETTFSYDAVNNLATLTDSVGNTTTWFRDNLNRVIEEENELGDSRYFQYDANGFLTQKTDRNERVTQYIPDNLGRTIQENWLDGLTVVRSFDFEFDAASQLLTASDPDANYAFAYDNLGRTDSTTANLAGFSSSIVMAQAFDDNSNRLQLAVTIGTTADFVNDYSLDNLNRQSRIERHGVGGGNTVADTRIDLAYNADSQFDTIDRYADLAGENLILTTDFGYDLMGRLDALDHHQGLTSLAGYAFTFDAASRIDSIDSLIDGLTTYSYDTTNQLIGADFDTQTDETHEWDANGNPDELAADVGPNNQVLSDGTYEYEYDDEGNRTRQTKISDGSYTDYLWDYRNRLTDVIDYDAEDNVLQHVHYAYDFLNRWTFREIDPDGDGVAPSTAEWFAFDGYQVVLSFDDSEATSPSHRYLNGPVVDQYFTDENAENDVLQLLGDHLGTIRDTALYDAIAEETELKNHTIFGSFHSRLNDTDIAYASFIGETGRPHDFATGHDNHGARWLDAWLKRWLGEDPSSFAGSDTNLLRVMSNDAVSRSDPTGLKTKAEWQAIAIKNAGLEEYIGSDGSKWNKKDSDLIKNRELMVGLYTYYATLYRQDKKHLLWPGLGANAGRMVVLHGIDRLDCENRYLDSIKDTQKFNPFWQALISYNKSTRVNVSRILTSMSLDIFMDLAWQMEAFLGGGIKEMESLAESGEIKPDMLEAWRDIASGDPARLKRGTTFFTQTEQVVVLGRGYEEIGGVAGGYVAKGMSAEATAGLPSCPTFHETVPGGDIADTRGPEENDRWKWVRTAVLEYWIKLNQRQRDSIVQFAVDQLNKPANTTPRPTLLLPK